MKQGVLALALVLAVPACDASSDVVASGPDLSMTPTTGTNPPTTTTSTLASTTTTTLPPTTTTTVLEGNWADQPVVTSSIMDRTLGWWDGERWVQAEEGMKLPVAGGEDYQIALLGVEDARTTGGPQIAGCDILFPSDFPGIELADSGFLTREIGDERANYGPFISGVAISASWDLTPRAVSEGKTHPGLESAAVLILSQRGFETDTVTIRQVVDADLDGDGNLEAIVVAEDTQLANEGSGVYSIVFALSASFDEPKVVEESIIPPSESGFPASFRIGAIADLNGDGVMEVVVDGGAWENSWVQVFELHNSRFEARIGAGCGV